MNNHRMIAIFATLSLLLCAARAYRPLTRDSEWYNEYRCTIDANETVHEYTSHLLGTAERPVYVYKHATQPVNDGVALYKTTVYCFQRPAEAAPYVVKCWRCQPQEYYDAVQRASGETAHIVLVVLFVVCVLGCAVGAARRMLANK